MKIGIDGYNMAMPHGTGVAGYGFELARALEALGMETLGVFGLGVPADPALRESEFFDRYQRQPPPPAKIGRYRRKLRSVRALRSPKPRDVPVSAKIDRAAIDEAPPFDALVSADGLFENAFTRFRLTGRFTRLRLPAPPDVMHWTYPLPITVDGVPNIYTLHDLVPLKLPQTTLDDKTLYGKLVARCVEAAALVCTVSDSSRRDIVERFPIDPARVVNTYQTGRLPPSALRSEVAADAHAIDGIFGLPYRGYFLYFGAIEPKKNVGRLIEAYLSLQSATPLVIVGARAWQADQELQLMPDGGAGGAAGTYRGHRGQTIVRLDYLPRELLAKLIRCAKAVVFPSLYEGFGLPVLEAMQLGTPVITSITSSLPEVVGPAGLLVDPYDVADLREAMRRVDGDEALCRAMATRGLEQAKLFSRERYQGRLTALYAAAMARR